ncbi:MAG: diguanylate cyclase [Acidobacteriaceae bacterium]
MSIRVMIAAYSLSLLAALIGCTAIARSRYAVRGLWWIVGALANALLASLLFASISYLPDFLTIVVANEAILSAFLLLHQSIASVLRSRRRYIALGVMLAAEQFLLYLQYTYMSPDIRMRIVVRSIAIATVAALSATVLFRQSNLALRYPAQVAGWGFAGYGAFQLCWIGTSFIWPPSPDRLHPVPAQAFYSCFNFLLGMSVCFSVVWLAVCAQRRDLHLMATTDGLSGLMNRRAFDEVLKQEIQSYDRRQEPMAVLLIDLDHFKRINDEFGHAMGDQVIRRVSKLLSANTRSADEVARYGGEEFVMLLRGQRLDRAESIAERLRTQIEAMTGLPEPVSVTVSIGIAMRYPKDSVATLLKRSDDALYASKRGGRNRVSTELCVQQIANGDSERSRPVCEGRLYT